MDIPMYIHALSSLIVSHRQPKHDGTNLMFVSIKRLNDVIFNSDLID